MRRHKVHAETASLRKSFILFLGLFAVLTALTLLLSLAKASAQSASPDCGDGLVTPDDVGTGSLLLKTSTPGRYLPAPRVATDVDVHVAGGIERTRLTQRFENPADGWVEGVYVFPLPDGAAVDTLKLQIGDRFLEGKIKERQEARRIYEKAKADGKKASLVEQQRPNVFTNEVANIGPHEVVNVQIEYQDNLRFDQGRYHLRVPLVVAPRYAPAPQFLAVHCSSGARFVPHYDPLSDPSRLDSPVLRPEAGKVNPVRLTVEIQSGFPLGAVVSNGIAVDIKRLSPSDATVTLHDGVVPADRDFVLTYAAAPGTAPTASLLSERKDGADYLLAVVMPPGAVSHGQPRPREAIFVLDNSGSMAGESIREAKAGLLMALDRLGQGDRFNVIRFDDTLTLLFPKPVDATPENIAFAKGYVSNIDAAGGTEMLPALNAALDDATPDDQTRLRQVIFLTDGEVANEAQLFAAIKEKLGRSRLFTIGIGSSPNGYFMAGAAHAGRGTYTYIGARDEVEAKMTELFAKLERPVMTGLKASWPAGMAHEAWPDPLPDLYDGEPVIVAAQANDLSGTLVLSGQYEGRPWASALDLSKARPAEGIEKLWARSKIAALEDSRILGNDPAAIDKAILDVALAHRLTSRLTSLVAVDVTPSRPLGAALTRNQVPLNLPAGWDFDKVFGETAKSQNAIDVPAGLIKDLSVKAAPDAVVAPEDAGLSLPQGGTDEMLLLIAGAMCIVISMLIMRRTRAPHLF